MAEYLRPVLTIKCAAGTAASVAWCPPPGVTVKLLKIDYLPNATTAADGTDYVALRAYKGTGTGTPLCASRTTAAAALTAYTVVNETLTAVGKDLEISQSNPLHIDLTHAASGKAADLVIMPQFEVMR